MEKNNKDKIISELIHIAAVLVQAKFLPSEYCEDYKQKTYSRKRVAAMMEKSHEVTKDLAVQIRKIADSLAS